MFTPSHSKIAAVGSSFSDAEANASFVQEEPEVEDDEDLEVDDEAGTNEINSGKKQLFQS